MNRTSFHSRSSRSAGFTLVELLVVIGIIAILAGVLFPGISAAINSAKRAKATTLIGQIQTSVLAYYTEYSVYPVPSNFTSPPDYSITDAPSDKDKWSGLIYALSGNVNPYNPSITSTPSVVFPNTRQVTFLTLKASDVDVANTTNAPLNPISYDKTNHPYLNLAIDSDYSGIIGDSTSAVTMPNFAASTTGNISSSPSGTSTAGVALWANCNTTTTPTQWNPAFFVHTY